jgi:hypothetical protein
MPVLLRCDCPGCFREIQAVLTRGNVAAPHPWWMQTGRDGKLIVACGTEHLNAALPGWVRPPTEEPQA